MGPPPGYTPGSTPAPSDSKTNPFVNQATRPGGPSHGESEDERLARQLQEEENARAGAGSRGAAGSYMSGSPGPSQYPDQLPPRPGDANDRGNGDKSRGLLGKIFGGNKNKQQQYPGQGGYPQQQGGYGGSPGPQQGYYQTPPPQQVCIYIPLTNSSAGISFFMTLPTISMNRVGGDAATFEPVTNLNSPCSNTTEVLPLASMAAMGNPVMDLSLATDHLREEATTAANHSTAADISRGK